MQVFNTVMVVAGISLLDEGGTYHPENFLLLYSENNLQVWIDYA
jgi:hypothetical protein